MLTIYARTFMIATMTAPREMEQAEDRLRRRPGRLGAIWRRLAASFA
jgi:hypothetical protein